MVIVETARGMELGHILIANKEIDESELVAELKPVERKATDEDLKKYRENLAKREDALKVCAEKIEKHRLEMKLIDVEFMIDGSKIVFYFSADGRVDFRELAKDLAGYFKNRIELRQIGVRDEAKMLGGLGPCGRPICCGAFLDQFQPVSIKMAKEQNLSLNPTKISGVCGRLMCCLKYEQEHYEMTRKRMPKVGKDVITPDGTGPVTELNIVKETVFVRLTNGDTSEIKEYPLDAITRPQDNCNNLETVKKSGKKETPADKNKSNNPEETDRKATETDLTKNETVFQEKTDQKTDQDVSNVKTKGKERGTVLGQPVKRENPNRVLVLNNQKNEEKADAEKESGQSAGTGKGSWADALQKAIDAISQDN
ncbi:MAG: stage 0 sporulation family protein, partial [Methanocorpusculum sp.]|nr:stage 0 sporulation family protein [Methanocorpusculum sp.]